MTELLYQADAYAREIAAEVLAADAQGIVLDRTVFYPQGGGQPGDTGILVTRTGEVPITGTVYSKDRSTVRHVAPEGAALPIRGETVTARLHWAPRYARMRIHTALHLLSVVLPYPVTGGAIGEGDGRLDFDLPENIAREQIQDQLRELIDRDAAVGTRWITDDELLANPGLVKTMSVKPPMGTGRIRLVEIEGIDLQPCGGTHVSRTAEIGAIEVKGIEKKGRLNRRVRIALAAEPS